MSNISEINKDTFWELIAQAKEQCGQDQDAFCQWLEDRLIEMGPEQALNFDYAAFAYRAAAYKYGLWSAASVMLDGCTDDGFTDFRGWLIAQGRDVYMAALKDPDSLADVPVYGDCCFETICYVGNYAYAFPSGNLGLYPLRPRQDQPGGKGCYPGHRGGIGESWVHPAASDHRQGWQVRQQRVHHPGVSRLS